MDHRTWPWKKRSSEKTIFADGKVDNSKRSDEKVQKLAEERQIEGDKSFNDLMAKYASIPVDCQAKDDLILFYEKAKQEAIAEREKAEARALLLEQELDEAKSQQTVANQRLTHLETELKECTQQLSALKEEAEQSIHESINKASREFVKVHKKSEEKLTDANKKLASLSLENTSLGAEISLRGKLIEDLRRCKSLAESEFDALMARLDATEKENAFLKYEFRLLEKELVIRNEELVYNRQSAEVSNKKHLQALKKITKLEAECQRLRLMTQKRFAGPSSALTKTKGEERMLGRDQTEARRRKPGVTTDIIVRETSAKDSLEFPSHKTNCLIEQLRDVEEQNKTLKELIAIKDAELHSSRISHAGTTSRLLQLEARFAELSKGPCMELASCESLSNDLSQLSEDSISSGSWAQALISELEHFKNDKVKKSLECKRLSLMGNFAETDKLAIVAVESPSGSENHLCSVGKEIVKDGSSFGDARGMIQSETAATPTSFDWLQVVLNAIMEQKRASKRSLVEIVEDIRIALGFHNSKAATEAQATRSPICEEESECLPISGYLTWKSPVTSPVIKASSRATTTGNELGERTQQNLRNLVEKIVRLTEDFKPTILNIETEDLLGKCQSSISYNQAAPKDYTIRVFQWRSSELCKILQKFINACNDLLHDQADIESFAEALANTLDWILDNHGTPKHASTMRHKIETHSNWNGLPNAKDLEVDGPPSKSNPTDTPQKQTSISYSLSDKNLEFWVKNNNSTLHKENQRLKLELKQMESAKKDIIERLQLTNEKIEVLMIQLQQAEESIGNLKVEVENLQESKRIIEDQMENQKSLNEDLDTQLSVAKAKLNEVYQKFSSLEVELEDRNHCCEDLESTCLELQLQLESVAKGTPEHGANQEKMLSQTGWEISAASVKLAECQETILNIGRQLKALASPNESALLDKALSGSDVTNITKNNKTLNKRFSLRDRMLAEDDPEQIHVESPKVSRGFPSTTDARKLNALVSPSAIVHTPEAYLGLHSKSGNGLVGALAIIPSKKQGGVSFLRKLLLRRKKRSRAKSQSLTKI